MASFKRVMERAIKSGYTKYERSYYEEKIAIWEVNGWLEVDEINELLSVLDEVYDEVK